MESRLVPGEWDILVEAFASGGEKVGSGRVVCMLQPGRTTMSTVTVYPAEGTGSLALMLSYPFALPAGSRTRGSLTYQGLPGQESPETPVVYEVDVPGDQTALRFDEIAAGHYTLALTAFASDGTASGGIVDNVMVVAGFTSTGTCVFEMGDPVSKMTATLFPSNPLEAPLLSVRHQAAETGFPLPLAVPRHAASAEDVIERRWYLNGSLAGDALEIVENRGLLPSGSRAYPKAAGQPEVSLVSASLVETSTSQLRSGSGSVSIGLAGGLAAGAWKWKASYDYRAAMGEALLGGSSAHGAGKGVPYGVKAVASSETGLVIVSGLDDEAALHAFAAGYGARLSAPMPSGATSLGTEASWIRLWRDRIRVGTTYRTADILAISDDGRYVAAASTNSDWIRVSRLDESGQLAASWSLTSTSTPNLALMHNVRGLRFSPDSSYLYVAANTSGSVYCIQVNPTGISYKSHVALSLYGAGTVPPIKDLEISSSGAILVSSSEASRIYILNPEPALAETGYLQSASSYEQPYHPSCMEVSPGGDRFYVLCDGRHIVGIGRSDPSQQYAVQTSTSLPPPLYDSNGMSLGIAPGATNDTLFITSGTSAAFIEMNAGMEIASTSLLVPAPSDDKGLSTAAGTDFARGAFFLAGGNGTQVSVFGAD
jgi:DNA-binding beta-propeller fold protein YncE